MEKLKSQILGILTVFLILTVGILYLLYNHNKSKTLVNKVDISEFVCGTVSSSLTEGGRLGREIFNTDCASCHFLKKKLTAPALAKTDSITLWNWLTLNNSKIDSLKLYHIGIDYHKSRWANALNINQLNGLYEYLNW